MSFVSINLTTKALIRALQWRSLEAQEQSKAEKKGKKKKDARK